MKTRRDNFFLTISVFFCLLALGIALGLGARSSNENGSASGGEKFALTILHTNDIHAHDEPFQDHKRVVGGLSRIAYLVHSLKSTGRNTIALDAGDFFQGTILYQKYRGEVEVNLFNMVGYDAVTLGNHEFDDGPLNLSKQLAKAKFPVISCNLDLGGEEQLARIVRPSILKEIAGEKVAVIGAITPDLERIDLNLGSVRVRSHGTDWIKPIKEEVLLYKNQGVDKIILLTHCGIEADKTLAQTLSDVDVIVGGHSHTRLEEPLWIPHADGSLTAVVQTGSYGRALGKFDLAFDGNGHLIERACQYQLIKIDKKLKEDQQAVAYLKEKMAPMLALRHQIDGYADRDFDNTFRTMPYDSAIGDLICDALAEKGTDYGAHIAFQNRGGIRARIEKGPISEEKVEEILPFDNKPVFATISGAKLLNVLEHSVGGPLGGSFLDVHGLKLSYDAQKPKGSRIVSVKAEDDGGNWQPVKPDKDYKIVINDYNFKGGEAYDFKAAKDVVYTEGRISDSLRDYLLKHKHVEPTKLDRIVPLNH
jgi:5'-nucleotidase / UDP-sugar diphosphatase